MSQFSSEGFDLDALQGAGEGAVLEVGGRVVLPSQEENPMKDAEALKQRGNVHFQQHHWLEALDLYSQAIQATPGSPTGAELLQLQAEWQEEQAQLARQRLAENEEQRRQGVETTSQQPPQPKFEPPKHVHGEQLAIYHNNRAACLLQLDRIEQAIEDCNIAVLLNPTYTKAWMRRATCHERAEKTDLALQDAQQALQLDPYNAQIQKTVQRLQKLEDERLEQLKEETMDKLKDLGNSILGNFGLSLNNFKAEQDPNSGSYSISFQQNNNSSE